jgi:hypothetical protein
MDLRALILMFTQMTVHCRNNRTGLGVTVNRLTCFKTVVRMNGRFGIRRRPDIVNALCRVAVDALSSIISPELEYSIMNGVFVSIDCLGLGTGKAYNIVKIFVGMTTGTKFNYFQRWPAGFVLETVGDVNESFLEPLFLVAV